MEHLCTARDRSHLLIAVCQSAWPSPSENARQLKITLFPCNCLSEMALAFCTVTHCIQLNGQT